MKTRPYGSSMQIKRTGIVLSPNSRRVVLRPFIPFPEERKLRIIARVATLPEEEVDRLIAHVLKEFHGRHQRPRDFLLARFEKVREHLITGRPVEREPTALDRCVLHARVRRRVGGPL